MIMQTVLKKKHGHGSLLLSEASELNDDHFGENISWLHFLSYAPGVTVELIFLHLYMVPLNCYIFAYFLTTCIMFSKKSIYFEQKTMGVILLYSAYFTEQFERNLCMFFLLICHCTEIMCMKLKIH